MHAMDMRILTNVPDDYLARWTQWTKRFRGRGSVKRKKILRFADRAIKVAFVALYGFLVVTFATGAPAAVMAFGATTVAGFLIVQTLCQLRNAPRPFEAFELKPLIPKKDLRSGRSFPSRWTFFAFMLGTFLALIFRSIPGCLFLALAGVLGWIHVMEGVSFPRDVSAGAVLGAITAAACLAALLTAYPA